jgi:5-formyltetrahydrofolate cyclo-ligase
MSITVEKNLLRTHYKEVRKSLMANAMNGTTQKSLLDEGVFNSLVNHVDFRQYRAVLCYVSFGIEVDTHRLIDYLNSIGVPVYAPKCYKSDSSMKFFAIDGVESLTYGEYKGILEPLEDESKRLTNYDDCLCIVPALAFDRDGQRLGWGGGYYDRLFSVQSNLLRVGITYSNCLCERMPIDCFDIPMDMVVTEKNILFCGGNNEHSRFGKRESNA